MRTIGAGIVVLALATPVSAQEVSAGLSVYGPFGVNDLDGDLPAMLELRVTVPLSRRFALEPFFTAGAHRDRRRSGMEGFYGAQIRQLVWQSGAADPAVFASYGVSMYYSRGGTSPPLIGHLGVGLSQRLTERLAVRPEVQVITYHVVPIGARVMASLSMRLD